MKTGYATISNMRFYLRLAGVKDVHLMDDKGVVNQFAKLRGPKEYWIGIDPNGEDIKPSWRGSLPG